MFRPPATIEDHQVRGEREDVVQRQRGQHHLLAEAQERLPHLEALHRVRDQVAVREHRALRDAGRAAGVLQRGDAVVIERLARRPSDRRRPRCDRAPCASACVNVVCAKVIGGTIFFTYFCTALHEEALQRRQQIGNADHDNRA